MKNHFARLRRFIIWSSVGSPLLFFVAFLFIVYGWAAWAALPVIVGLFLRCAFPLEFKAADRAEDLQQKMIGWLMVGGGFLVLSWINSRPEWDPLITRLLSKESLQDWRPMTAVFIWLSIWGFRNYQKARSLKDEEIVRIFGNPKPCRSKAAGHGGAHPSATCRESGDE